MRVCCGSVLRGLPRDGTSVEWVWEGGEGMREEVEEVLFVCYSFAARSGSLFSPIR